MISHAEKPKKKSMLRQKAVACVRRLPKGSIWQTRYVCLPLAIVLSTLALSHSSQSYLMRAMWFGLGLVTWSFLEYILHRFVLHYHPTSDIGGAVIDRLHALHHHNPKDETQVCVPIFLNLAFWGTVFGLIVLFGGAFEGGLIFTSGVALLMVIYDITHYSAHYSKPSNTIMHALKRHHTLHHFSDHRKRFGVTSPIWDYVFRTI